MKKSTNNIIFILGLLLIIGQAALLDSMLQKGILIIPKFVNFATLLYDLCYWFGFCFFGIIGLVLTIIGAVYMNKTEKK